MPIEIRELVIKASVGDAESANDNNASASGAASGGMSTDAVVKQCVEQVLAILKEKTER